MALRFSMAAPSKSFSKQVVSPAGPENAEIEKKLEPRRMVKAQERRFTVSHALAKFTPLSPTHLLGCGPVAWIRNRKVFAKWRADRAEWARSEKDRRWERAGTVMAQDGGCRTGFSRLKPNFSLSVSPVLDDVDGSGMVGKWMPALTFGRPWGCVADRTQPVGASAA
ncbi:hypothetical protein [Sphingobium sp.]|uniref:hypothetical protein n=1 Tax=Sphingobium sp. TaxID=1912891 RepID=UPI0035C6F1B8